MGSLAPPGCHHRPRRRRHSPGCDHALTRAVAGTSSHQPVGPPTRGPPRLPAGPSPHPAKPLTAGSRGPPGASPPSTCRGSLSTCVAGMVADSPLPRHKCFSVATCASPRRGTSMATLVANAGEPCRCPREPAQPCTNLGFDGVGECRPPAEGPAGVAAFHRRLESAAIPAWVGESYKAIAALGPRTCGMRPAPACTHEFGPRRWPMPACEFGVVRCKGCVRHDRRPLAWSEPDRPGVAGDSRRVCVLSQGRGGSCPQERKERHQTEPDGPGDGRGR